MNKNKWIQVRVDEKLLSQLEYLIDHGLGDGISGVVRRLIRDAFRKEKGGYMIVER